MVNGQVEDWTNYPVAYYENDETRVVMGFTNDETALNMIIRFHDHKLARLFEGKGVTLWFDDNNQKEKAFGIHYVNPAAKNIGLLIMEMFGRDLRRKKHLNETGTGIRWIIQSHH